MRTKNSIRNIISVVFFNIVIGLLGFLKVKVFVGNLSDDIYSLNQLFYQIFSYITIADIGFGLILNQRLYQAFAKNNKEEINNIYSTSKKFYNMIGIIMLVVSFVISFFVQFLTKAEVSTFYIQVIFIIFIIRNVIDYFFIAPRYIMDADQKNYKINHLIKGIKILETVIEMILVLMGVDYLFILFPGILLTVIIDLYVNHKVYRDYPWLQNNHTFHKKYLKGTKDLIYQRISGLLNSNTDIVLISAFINPLSVVIYTSYSYITKFVIDTIYIASSAITPSFANALNKETKEKSYSIFKELNILFLFIASFCTIMIFGFLNPFISLWVGDKYLTSSLALILFCFTLFESVSIRAIIITINSKGLFKETKIATIIEAIINLIISILLVHKFGLVGVLLGTVISFLVPLIQNACYIYKNIFGVRRISYFFDYSLVILFTCIFMSLFTMISFPIHNLISWFVWVIISSLVTGIILFLLFYICFEDFRKLIMRTTEFTKLKSNYIGS